jgi:TetR/AcrR family transcriptional regulator, transcriptional repressor for nem operon
MARPKEFDREEVLGKAMQLLWEKGIEATSIKDLVEHMGIGRGSMYDTFGSKEELIVEAMDCYVAHMKQALFDTLEQPGPARVVIRNLFVALVERGHAGNTKSCLMAKSAMMAGRENVEMMDRVCQFMDSVEEALHQVLLRGREEGDIPTDKDPRALARFLTNSMQGISITAHTRAEHDALVDVIEVTLSVLD